MSGWSDEVKRCEMVCVFILRGLVAATSGERSQHALPPSGGGGQHASVHAYGHGRARWTAEPEFFSAGLEHR